MITTYSRTELAHYSRAAQCYEFNARYFPLALDARWPYNPAVMMTAINLGEFQGILRGLGPVKRLTDADKAKGFTTDSPTGLYVGNDNGSVDSTAWQINGGDPLLLPETAAYMAHKLWSTSAKKDPFEHWYAYKNRNLTDKSKQDWGYFLGIAAGVPGLLNMPLTWRDAQPFRKKKA